MPAYSKNKRCCKYGLIARTKHSIAIHKNLTVSRICYDKQFFGEQQLVKNQILKKDSIFPLHLISKRLIPPTECFGEFQLLQKGCPQEYICLAFSCICYPKFFNNLLLKHGGCVHLTINIDNDVYFGVCC
jgi:hypothetical protein